jgi:uncharacterized caspase-like protein
VRNGCEAKRPPILGLQESILADQKLVQLFGLGNGQGEADIVWSPTPKDAPPTAASTATSHGGFDDDGPCMNSVLRRILDIPDHQALVQPNLGETGREDASETADASPFPSSGERGAAGRRIALCIGIDDYPAKPLNGCVADARQWGAWLSSAGFDVKYLFDAQATKRAMLEAMRALLESAAAGDVVAIQYAGHGTQVQDVSGDEGDRLDEAWVPHDYAQAEFVLDDEIAALVDRYRAKQFELVLFTDCCHSGSNTRLMIAGDDPRLAPNSRLLRISAELNARFVEKQRRQRAVAATRKDDDLGWEIHFAACQDDQSAYEEQGHGRFTVAAMKALRDARTYGDLADRLRSAFTSDTRQTPNFRALPDRRGLPMFRGGAQPAVVTATPDDFGRGDYAAQLERIERRLDLLSTRIDAIAKRP